MDRGKGESAGLLRSHRLSLFSLGVALAMSGAQAQPENRQDSLAASIPGEVLVEPPTLHSLGFEWPLEGDANRNASVEISYRKAGEAAWRKGLPLLRLGGEAVRPQPPYDITVPNMFAGSLFDLEEGTDYEVILQMRDPDGVAGSESRQLRVRTRSEPSRPTSGRVFHVYPHGFEGEREEPSFTGLLSAYNTGSNSADWANAFVPRVRPGDTIVIHAGVYTEDRRRYAAPGNTTLFDGTYYLTAKGTEEAPIAIVAAGDGDVVFDGQGTAVLFNLQAADHHYFEGIQFRNADLVFDLGRKGVGGAQGFTLKRSVLQNVGRGVFTDWGGSANFYIADNLFVGRNSPERLMGWIGRTWQSLDGFPQPLVSESAIKVYGPGHVIAYNRVANFHDGIAHATYGMPDDWPNTPMERMPVSIDIYNNDVSNVDDNCIEPDGVAYNVRVLRNRCFNQAHRALSTQPALGGPVYFVRNVVYHAPEGGPLKLTAQSAGVMVLNNTFFAEVREMGPVSNVHYRNNLILGQGAWPEVFSTQNLTAYSSSDFNGFDVSARPIPFAITLPNETSGAAATEARRGFASLEEYRAATGWDTNSIAVGYGDFVHATPPDRGDPTRLYDPADFDFRLGQGSRAIDAGAELPNVTDGFTGRAPDLGAYEQGLEVPHYGPRTGAASR